MSYRLNCPVCTTLIPPENINIQEMMALCPKCGAVFNVRDNSVSTPSREDVAPVEKMKRRKSKQPHYITHRETTDGLLMEMPTLFTQRERRNSFILGFIFLAGYVLSLAALGTGAEILWWALLLGIILLPLIGLFFSSLVAKQYVEIDAEHLKHFIRWPIPHNRIIDVADIVGVSIEEATVTRESTLKSRYIIYADRYDGRQELFMSGLLEAPAFYIYQVLSEYFREVEADESHLSPDDALQNFEDVLLQAEHESAVDEQQKSKNQ